MPPTKPTLPVLLAIAAIMPTRKLPSCSLKTMLCTLGSSTTASMIANCCFGETPCATFSMLQPCEKPTPTMGSAPRSAMRRSACSRCASLAISNSR